MKERSKGTRAVPLFPPGCISRDHAAVASEWHYFVLWSRLARTCPHRALAVYSF